MNTLIEEFQVKNFFVKNFLTIPSTMVPARESEEFTVIFTDNQTSGRGKGDRKWEGSKGNLFFSISLKPKKPLSEVAQLSFVSSLVLAKVLEESFSSSKDKINCKWPNDVLFNSKKIAGILVENKIDNLSLSSEKSNIVVGIGVNVVHCPSEVLFKATSLKNENIETTAKEVLSKFLETFSVYYDKWLNEGFSTIRKEWLSRAYKINERISAKSKKEALEGKFVDLTKDGELLIETDEGELKKIYSADIF